MTTRTIAIGMAGAVYWYSFSFATGAREPWDAPTFWTIGYPLSLLLSAIGGAMLGRRGWRAGLLITVAQLAVIMVHSPIAPLFVVGLLYAAILAVPAMIISATAGRISTARSRQ